MLPAVACQIADFGLRVRDPRSCPSKPSVMYAGQDSIPG